MTRALADELARLAADRRAIGERMIAAYDAEIAEAERYVHVLAAPGVALPSGLRRLAPDRDR